MDVINVLAPLNTFAGGLTLATQFVLPCSEERLRALFVTASELYLSSLIALVTVFLLLYGFWDDDMIRGYRHTLIIDQFTMIGVAMIAAFILLGVAIIIGANQAIGIVGMFLFGILALTAAYEAYFLLSANFVTHGAKAVQDVQHAVPRHLDFSETFVLLVLFTCEGLLLFALLGVGIWQVVHPPGRNCSNTNLSIPSGTLAVSVVDLPTITSYAFTDLDTLLSFTLTDIDHKDGTIVTVTRTITSTTTSTISLAITTITAIVTTTFDPLSISTSGSSTSTTCSTTTASSVHCLQSFTAQSSFVTSTVTCTKTSTVSCSSICG
jgi:hypothetical protein